MTKEEILAMEPGPELDKEVALALGLVIFEGDQGLITVSNWADGERQDLPPFSTDIKASWSVVDRLNLFKDRIYLTGHDHEWVIVKDESMGQYIFARGIFSSGKTPMEAICKAALIATFVGSPKGGKIEIESENKPDIRTYCPLCDCLDGNHDVGCPNA